MIIKIYIYYLLPILVFVSFLLSCTTRKKEVVKEKIIYKVDTLQVRDSISTEKIVYVQGPSVIQELIEKPCDSLGNLKDFNMDIKFPYGKINLQSDKGNIKAKVNTDSISSVFEKQYYDRNKKQIHELSVLEKEKTKEIKSKSFYQYVTGISVGINILFALVFIVWSIYRRYKNKIS